MIESVSDLMIFLEVGRRKERMDLRREGCTRVLRLVGPSSSPVVVVLVRVGLWWRKTEQSGEESAERVGP